jgi:hypothetical protein
VRRFWLWAAAGLLLVPALGMKADGKLVAVQDEKEACHGTSVEFLDTPSEAAKQALKEKKLVFVLHVSGNFEDPRFT